MIRFVVFALIAVAFVAYSQHRVSLQNVQLENAQLDSFEEVLVDNDHAQHVLSKGHGHGRGRKTPKRPANPPVEDEDSVVAILDRWNRFISEEDKIEKFCVMATGPFRFFRGSNHLFWERFAHDPKLLKFGGGKSFRTWVQGDLHPENFGSFHDADSQLIYNTNDFGSYLSMID
jgi:hypothetical protein